MCVVGCDLVLCDGWGLCGFVFLCFVRGVVVACCGVEVVFGFLVLDWCGVLVWEVWWWVCDGGWRVFLGGVAYYVGRRLWGGVSGVVVVLGLVVGLVVWVMCFFVWLGFLCLVVFLLVCVVLSRK